ncbi:MAG: hypothetical protein AAF773_00965 [Cyanobacteria bacterium P01_D01_bin.115]
MKDLQKYWSERDQPRGPLDRELPEWAQSKVNYLRLVLICLLMVMTFSGFLSGCSALASGDWQAVTELLTDAQLQTVMDENTSNLPEPQRAELLEAMRAQAVTDTVVAIDFNSPLLTGQLGTLFAVYAFFEDHPRSLLQIYLTDGLPPGNDFALLHVTDRLVNGLPCLQVDQLQNPAQPEVARLEYCYDGNTYVFQSQINLPFADEGSL